MEKFTKNTLKAAVKVYGTLHLEGKSEDEIKLALSGDENGYTTGQIDEIYTAITATETGNNNASYKVVAGKSFRDKEDFSKEYTEESDISHLSKDRIDHLLSIGYIEEA